MDSAKSSIAAPESRAIFRCTLANFEPALAILHLATIFGLVVVAPITPGATPELRAVARPRAANRKPTPMPSFPLLVSFDFASSSDFP
jgi:hypothetical protein